MVVPNGSYDTDFAISLAKQFQEEISQYLESNAQEIIGKEIEKISYINRRWIQERCDGLLNVVDKKWLHEYIENPIQVIENYFHSIWKTIQDQINRILIEQKTRSIEIVKEFFQCIKSILNAIKNEGAAVTFVDTIFQSDIKTELSVNENLKNKKRCMTKILFTYLSGEPTPNTVSIFGTTYKLKSESYDIFDRLVKHSPPSISLIELTKQMSHAYDNINIGNLTVFLHALLKERDSMITFFTELPFDFNRVDKADTHQRLLDRVRGCLEKCRCCRRPCDVDHTLVRSIPGSIDNRHCCHLGHALRAMNGYRYEITDEASLLMCEHIKDDQMIVAGNIRQYWSEFKKTHQDWNFDPIMSVDELNRLHGKFLGIWAKIGLDLCEKYRMKFVTTNIFRPVHQLALHYILLLDGSGSMKGKAWRDLLDGVREFLKWRSSRNLGDRISIVVFSSLAQIVYYNEAINCINVSTIPFPGCGTNFVDAFLTVHKIIKRSEEQSFSRTSYVTNRSQIGYAIVFMSDGQAEYPENELNALTTNYRQQIKRFWTVALGLSQKYTLEKINNTMEGFFLNIRNSSHLLEAYAEIACSYID